MSLLIPCSSCSQRTPGKLANLTWAWWTAANERIAYRQKLCTECFRDQVLEIMVKLLDQVLICPCCGISVADDMDPTYCTAYIPDVGKRQLELPTCPPCAVAVRVRAQVGATRLDDRPEEFGGQGANPSPQTPPSISPWAALGFEPRT